MTIRKPAVALLFILLTFTGLAQRLTRAEYIRKYQLLAISEMSRSGIPASIKMAQACLESSDGNSVMARTSNNHFGIKCKSDWTGARSYHDDDEKNECFRKYKTVEESYVDHTNFLMGNPRYSALFQLGSTDFAGWAHGLKKAGYATDPRYADKVIEIIELNQLWRLDHKMTLEEMAQVERMRRGDNISKTLTINPYSSREITLHNGMRSAITREGDNFEILAQEFGLKAWELRKFNDYPEGYEPTPGEILYLQHKKSRAQGMYELHRVAEGESMHYISQYYGIRMKALYRINKLKYGDVVPVGALLHLQKKSR